MTVIQDAKTYYKLSEPFADADAANAALDAFYAELRELRKKHRLADVHCIVRIDVSYEDEDQIGSVMSHCHAGSTLWAQAMCAWALGQESAEHRRLLNVLAAGEKAKSRPVDP